MAFPTPPEIPPELRERPQPTRQPPKRDPRTTTQQLMAVSVIGSNFAVTVGAGALIGYLLDRWLGTTPWILIGLAGLGLCTGTARLLREARPLLDPGAKPRR